MSAQWPELFRLGQLAWRENRRDDAERYLRAAWAGCKASDARLRRKAKYLGKLGSFLSQFKAGDPRQAESLKQESRAYAMFARHQKTRLTLAEERYGTSSPRLIARLLQVGSALGTRLYTGRHRRTETPEKLDALFKSGRKVLRRARHLAESEYGPLDERTTQTMSRLAHFYSFHADKPAPALPLLRNRWRRFVKMFGRTHFHTRHALWQVGFALNENREGAKAARVLERVLKLEEEAKDDRKSPSNTHSMLALIYADIGRKELALKHQRISVDLDDKKGMPASHVAHMRELLADALMEVRRYAEAETVYRTAVAAYERREPIPDFIPVELRTDSVFMRGLAVSNLGRAILQQKRYAEADECFKEAEAMVANSLGPNHYWVAETLARWLKSQEIQGKLKATCAEVERGARILLSQTDASLARDGALVSRYARLLEKCHNTPLAQQLRARSTMARADEWEPPSV